MISIRPYVGILLSLSIALCAYTSTIGTDRLTEQLIEQRTKDFANAQEKNKVVRKFAKAGTYILGAISALGGLYLYYKSGNTIKVSVPTASQEELQKRVEALELLVKGPKFGSGSWVKSVAWNILLSPSFVMGIAEQAARLSSTLTNKLFYSPTLAWYLHEHTHLGRIIVRDDEHSMTQMVLIPGQWAKELVYNATILDEASKSTVPVDHEYLRHRVTASFNGIIADMSGLIAFMQYTAANCEASSKLYLEASERARYLYNYTNSMSTALEQALLTTQSDKKQLLMPIVKGFFVELEQVLVSFVQSAAKRA